MKKELWEILVPVSHNKDKNLRFSYEHHKEWDAFVKGISGGVTIMKTAKGEWLSPNGILHIDRMIPCRIVCNEEQISDIIDFTIDHYKQEAVLAYKISNNVILRHKTSEIKSDVPPPPPIGRINKEGGSISKCDKCGSDIKRNFWGLGEPKGCIQPKCVNYWDKESITLES